ncbi:hypothetical protein D3C87_2037200 [compost metagenome]
MGADQLYLGAEDQAALPHMADVIDSSGYPKILSGSSEEPGAARIHSRTSVLLGVSAGRTGFNGL